MTDIEIGTTRTTRAIGRDVYRAARVARDLDTVSWLAVDGVQVAAIVPAAVAEAFVTARADFAEVAKAAARLAELARLMRPVEQGNRATSVVAALAAVDRAQGEVARNWSRSSDEAELAVLRELADAVRQLRGTS
jgi:hypothetical protein